MDLLAEVEPHRAKLQDWFRTSLTKEEIVSEYGYVGPNTFRAFPGQEPKKILHSWAADQLTTPFLNRVLSLKSDTEYHGWVKKLAEDLKSYWKKSLKTSWQEKACGVYLKVANLFMKQFVRWEALRNCSEREALIRRLHVPFDRYTLTWLRDHCEEYPEFKLTTRIPANPQMGFVKSMGVYDDLQACARRIAEKADIPPIYLDILLWNVPQTRKLAANFIREAGGPEAAKRLIDELSS
jgi:hypothetical protein